MVVTTSFTKYNLQTFWRAWMVMLVAIGSGLAGCASERVDSRPIEQLKTLFPLPDPQAKEQITSMLFWSQEQRDLGFQSMDLLLPTRALQASVQPHALELDLDERLNEATYMVGGSTYDIDEFMDQHNMGGLLVLQGDKIRFERYGLENNADSLWVSFSVAKSVTSLLFGAALKDGFIKSLDEPVTRYLPRMRGSAYDQSSIKNLLQMASGVAWNEDYEDPQSDVSQAGGMDGAQLQDYLSQLPRQHSPGDTFNYSTGETNLAGALLRAAIAGDLASYATNKIWQGFGMAAEGNWLLNEVDGVELGGCCISATLRDYGRIGRFVLAENAGRGARSVLPDNWVEESTTASKGSAGYGYFWWLMGDETFSALGIFGQSIYIDPKKDLVIVTHGSTPKAVSEDFSNHRLALLKAVAALY